MTRSLSSRLVSPVQKQGSLPLGPGSPGHLTGSPACRTARADRTFATSAACDRRPRDSAAAGAKFEKELNGLAPVWHAQRVFVVRIARHFSHGIPSFLRVKCRPDRFATYSSVQPCALISAMRVCKFEKHE